MKKYLFTAALAVAVSGAFVSCHEDEISGSLIEQKAKAFEEIFVEAFGQPAPNHTWGFKQGISANARGITRTEVDPKGNMWPDKPTVGTKEETDVLNYVNRETSTDWTWYYPMPENLNNYFVTQIHKGTDEYHGVNQTQTFRGSDQMDKLMIADATSSSVNEEGALVGSWFHVYDFNGGNSIDYGGNMLVIKSNTYDFSYHGSKDSKYHPRWIAIDGKDVERTDGVADNYDGYYYICFDYESTPNDTYTVFEMPEHNNAKAYVPGVWEAGTTGEDLINAGITVVYDGEWGVRTYTVQSGWVAGQVFNGDKWIPGNDIYTDWIIRLVKADVEDIPDDPTPPSGGNWKIVEGEKVIEAGRVFCEDLGASSLDDFDYNDIVFDAIIVNHYIKLVTTTVDDDGVETTSETTSFTKDGITGVSETYAKVCLLAAGGTIPANVCGHEVHNELGNGNLSTVVMINTTTDRETVKGAQIDYSCSPVIIQEAVAGQEGATQDKKFYYNSQDPAKEISCINDIDIVVLYGNAVTTITAPTGAVPHKICVPIGTPWAKERVNIGKAYTSFADYCGINPDRDFWNDIGKDGPVWENCGSLFTIEENGVERFIVEGDMLNGGENILAQGTGGSSSGGSGAIWSSTSYISQSLISADVLTSNGMVRGKAATIKITGTGYNWGGPGWGEIYIMKNDNTKLITAGSNQTPNYANLDSNTFYGYVSIPISADELNALLDSGGMKIEINNFNYTNVEIFQ